MSATHFQNKTDEWYTPMSVVELMFDLLDIKEPSTIMLPFDTEDSNFVKHASAIGAHNLWYNIRNWLDKDYTYDYLITNPPFSIKDKVIEKCYKSGKPSALLLPLDSLGGVKRHQLFKTYGFPTIYIPTKRIGYHDQSGALKKGVGFHSIIMIINDPQGSRLIWE